MSTGPKNKRDRFRVFFSYSAFSLPTRQLPEADSTSAVPTHTSRRQLQPTIASSYRSTVTLFRFSFIAFTFLPGQTTVNSWERFEPGTDNYLDNRFPLRDPHLSDGR